MKASVYVRPGVVEVQDRPDPVAGPGQVLVEVHHCGVCGSDIHMILEGWGTPNTVLGHEWTGVVVDVGEGVERWQVGDEVVGGPGPRCGRCQRCREGKPSQCEDRGDGIMDGGGDGAFARLHAVDERSLLPLPPGLTSRQAALAEPLAVALHGITRGGVDVGQSVMVFGAGPIGALAVAALVARGIGPITVVEPAESRQALARALGADTVIHPGDLEVYPLWEPERISPRAVDVVLECSGKKAAMEAGFNQLRRGGTLVFVGAGIDPPTFDPNRMILNELHVCGSFVYDADGFERALELLASGRIDTDLLIDPTDVPLDLLPDALARLADGTIAGKVLVVPHLSTTSDESEQP